MNCEFYFNLRLESLHRKISDLTRYASFGTLHALRFRCNDDLGAETAACKSACQPSNTLKPIWLLVPGLVPKYAFPVIRIFSSSTKYKNVDDSLLLHFSENVWINNLAGADVAKIGTYIVNTVFSLCSMTFRKENERVSRSRPRGHFLKSSCKVRVCIIFNP